uniref:NAD(P)(+)--arginine ADP-ribosyltransferase n=1 Tax=Gasterosteus aculeatus aculeatus TaxID=481459 RepID=A0AAQ4QZY5_GASAC|nr:ecto-ADP-ribosyltransferase 5-like [Gasterosteus aculeatus aculeatus]
MRMKMMMAVMVLWVVLLPYGVSGANLMSHAGRKPVATPPPPPTPPLDMAPNSVDDMYQTCTEQMEEEAATYLQNEKNNDESFRKSWKEAEKYEGFKLSKEQVMALYVYTSSKNKIYIPFNEATRTERFKYKTAFNYHALHFYLTTAVQNLRALQNQCYKVRRRTKTYYSDQDVLNKEVRFGSFASSSILSPGPVGHKAFGKKACFEIETCMGADISWFSTFNQREVLIPPYEVFKVTNITKRSEQPDLWCNVVYKLESLGYQSNRNCALINKEALQVSCS